MIGACNMWSIDWRVQVQNPTRTTYCLLEQDFICVHSLRKWTWQWNNQTVRFCHSRAKVNSRRPSDNSLVWLKSNGICFRWVCCHFKSNLAILWRSVFLILLLCIQVTAGFSTCNGGWRRSMTDPARAWTQTLGHDCLKLSTLCCFCRYPDHNALSPGC